jgi:hypothetical protein
MNRNPKFGSSELLPLTFSKSPSETPGHHDWLNITDVDSFVSCTQEFRTLKSPYLSGVTGIDLRMDWAVFDRLRPYGCWDSARDVDIMQMRGQSRFIELGVYVYTAWCDEY